MKKCETCWNEMCWTNMKRDCNIISTLNAFLITSTLSTKNWWAKKKKNLTKMWTFYNVTSIHNSHVSIISIIQRNSDVIRKQNHLKKWRNCNVIKLRRNGQRKWNAAVTLFQYVMQTYHKKVIQKWGPNTQSNCFVFSYVVGTYQ